MKILLQKISLLVIGIIATIVVHAQTIKVTATVNAGVFGVQSQVIANGQTFDATLISNMNAYLPVSIKVENTSTTNNLTLMLAGGKYVALSNTGVNDFTVNESTLTGTIAPGASQTFTVNLSATATNGTNKFITMTILSNDAANATYAGTIKYSFSGIVTALTKASDIGLSLYPNPSNDGQMHVTTNNVAVDRIVVSNVAGQTEEFTATEFKTSLKGLLLVRLYTDKGVVSEKIIIQE